MKKNITVGMPLAVPTQKRPPGKYASHPYPVLVDDKLGVSADLRGVGRLLPVLSDKLDMSVDLRGVGDLKSVFIDHKLKPDKISISTEMRGQGELYEDVPGYHLININNKTSISTEMRGQGVLRLLLLEHKLKPDKISISTEMRGLGVLAE